MELSRGTLTLSKSLYTRGLQCQKSLWLKKHNKNVLAKPDSKAEAIFQNGNTIGDLACKLFPNGIEIPYDNTTFEDKINLTKQYINEGYENIYEATFKFDDILIMVDILNIKDNSITINEVKSSTQVKDVYLHDASIQYYVLNGLGYDVKKVNIIHINNEYIRGKELDINQLFSIVDVTYEVKELQANIKNNLEIFRKTLTKDEEPNIDIGTHCNDPYECDAKNYCWNHIPQYSVFDISRLKSQKKFELYKNGIIEFKQITDINSFSISQQIQIKSEINNVEIINKEAIKDFIDTLTYPIYHLDFETFQQAIPEFEGLSPYQQIPFQYSLHIEHKDGTLEHKEYLALDGIDPREQIAKRLVEDIPSNVTVLAYNMGFEKGVIRKLASSFANLSDKLMAIHDNCKDLMTPFQNKDYYHPNMKGSYSIKYVLPALVPEFENAYKELDLIHNGGEAMEAFANFSNITDEKLKQRYRDSLLEYCKLDTLAMVKILEKLRESVS
ncbi:DUF2779 domain-containing protein (plasmid) [Arcobacter cryaerophilus gv. pseudocryaerophilus]|uniref:DUF2779 domain-containing protein n=3 Tax=Arcobacteraceae TaxID=2808963 RepID=A0AA96DVS5_9BACT|nr:DUF2779 domain-containing protein [Arcobacter sp. AZ-2023]WNL37331.1 DUF2779 domain-containing protein [Arcobacter sp. AZ-2023]WPD13046.1 DUF2779 domain-containing protein [Arcobacter sp. DSM 115960]